MIVITGALGFIGSALVQKLNEEGHPFDLCVVDNFYNHHKEVNLDKKFIREWIHRDIFLNIFRERPSQIDFVFHLGARTDTTEKNSEIFDELNVKYSQEVWKACADYQIPLVYASSAATYGDGKKGFEDNHDVVSKLKPLNPYGVSKNDFDLWALRQGEAPPFWAGLKFFNVYGPNEYHKERMASVIFHAYRQIRKTGSLKLFRSHNPNFQDGHQERDFVYIKDVVEVCYHFYKNQKSPNGLYNVGTGNARTFLDLGTNVFKAMGLEPNIEFIDTPKDIRDTYQYHTEANIKKLQESGFKKSFSSLEDGIEDYVQNYLMKRKYY